MYPGVFVPNYANKPDAFLRALDAAGRQGQGWMVFDLSYIDQYNWWPLLERAFSKDVPPPDRHAGLLSAVRSAMDGVK